MGMKKKVSHGGNLFEIIQKFGGELHDWVDLSTGVSPFSYPITATPSAAWHHLPQSQDGLEHAASIYYRSPVEPLAIAGSQAAIMALPTILANRMDKGRGVVLLPKVGYKEHQNAWQAHAHFWQVDFYDEFPTAEQIKQSDVVLMINPNNPKGTLYTQARLIELHKVMKAKGGYLIIDEAFVDCTPEHSIISPTMSLTGLIVLRSVGKFFGLAGARAGFFFAKTELMEATSLYLGPWTVTGPSRFIVKRALLDRPWQDAMRKKISEASERLALLLKQHFEGPIAESALFITVHIEQASEMHTQLCQQKIYARLCDEGDAIRFGLPASEVEWVRLDAALNEIKKHLSTEVTHA